MHRLCKYLKKCRTVTLHDTTKHLALSTPTDARIVFLAKFNRMSSHPVLDLTDQDSPNGSSLEYPPKRNPILIPFRSAASDTLAHSSSRKRARISATCTIA